MAMTRPRLLQVGNVGEICGGTAACAWTVTRALPAFDHTVAFLSPITEETRSVFAPTRLVRWTHVSPELVTVERPDIVLLHNTAAAKVSARLPAPTVQYLHSRITAAPADLTLCCSEWLRQQFQQPVGTVLWQAVPCPPAAMSGEHVPRKLTIGRICTPRRQKWPMLLIAFYAEVAQRFPDVCWEFVGCPSSLQPRLTDACQGRARFYSASWERRSLLGRWDAVLYHQPELPESFGRIVAEAMRAGCVPIVDRQGGFIEQLSAGGGWLCGSRAEFLQAVQQLHDPAARRHESGVARRIGHERWSLDRFARDLLVHFDEAVVRRSSNPK
jgi:hypothetical protein